MNYPVNRSNLIMFKSLLNEVSVHLKDIDRKPVDLATRVPTFHMIDRGNSNLLLTKALTVVNAQKGYASLTVTSADLSNVELGTYAYAISLDNNDGTLSPVYTDRSRMMMGEIEVVEGPLPLPRDAVRADPSQMVITDEKRVSSAYPGAAQYGASSGDHTATFITDAFTGEVTIQAALDVSMTNASWFDVETLTFTDDTGTTARTFTGNYMWVRFLIRENGGTLSEIALRA